jgi:uncharacterized protein (DUF2141 family)
MLRQVVIGTALLIGSAATLAAQEPASAAGATGRVAGTVLDASTDTPVALARVTLLPILTYPPDPRKVRSATGIASQEGLFEITGLAPGSYSLTIHATGYISPHLTSGDPIVVEIRRDVATQPVTLRLSRGATISGRIRDMPSAGMGRFAIVALHRRDTLSLAGDGGRQEWARAATSTANEAGEFHLTGLPPGSYAIAAAPSRPPFDETPKDPTTPVVTFYPGVAEIESAEPVVVSVGRNVEALEFGVLVGPAFSVSGVVEDAEGKPAGDSLITAIDPESAAWAPRTARSRLDGTFVINGVPPGTYVLQAGRITRGQDGSTTMGRAMTFTLVTGGGGSGGVAVTVTSDDVDGVVVRLSR